MEYYLNEKNELSIAMRILSSVLWVDDGVGEPFAGSFGKLHFDWYCHDGHGLVVDEGIVDDDEMAFDQLHDTLDAGFDEHYEVDDKAPNSAVGEMILMIDVLSGIWILLTHLGVNFDLLLQSYIFW